MVAFFGRFFLVWMAGRVFGRIVQHPKVAPLAQSPHGRLAFTALNMGLNMHPRTRLAGSVVRRVTRRHKLTA